MYGYREAKSQTKGYRRHRKGNCFKPNTRDKIQIRQHTFGHCHNEWSLFPNTSEHEVMSVVHWDFIGSSASHPLILWWNRCSDYSGHITSPDATFQQLKQPLHKFDMIIGICWLPASESSCSLWEQSNVLYTWGLWNPCYQYHQQQGSNRVF